MGTEIERKYLVKTDAWQPQDAGVPFTQGYLNSQKERVVRVRLEGPAATLTVKGITAGVTRAEFEYRIPVEDAAALLQLCEQPLIDKHRHVEQHGGRTWEIDVFHGENEGLVIAEIELASERETPELPAWVGEEVSSDPRYYNANPLKNPYKNWRGGPSAAGGGGVPRAEFRVFGQGIVEGVKARLWNGKTVLSQVRRMPAEVYLLSRFTDEVNVKVRDGLLDVKVRIGTTPEGYEIFEPRGKHPLPVTREDLAAVLSQLRVPVSLPSNTYTFDDLVALARQHQDLRVVRVEKMRYGFSIDGVLCEYALVWFNGALVESACVESDNHAAIRPVVEALGLDGHPNVNYLRAAKAVVGF
jgi:CYTH domain-containing protein